MIRHPQAVPRGDDLDDWQRVYGGSLLGIGCGTAEHPFPLDINELEHERRELAEHLARRRPPGFTAKWTA